MENNFFITESAEHKIKKIIEEYNEPPFFRIYITGGGCSGFQYGFVFENGYQEDDYTFDLNIYPDIKIIIDSISIQYLQNSKLDYIEDLMGSYMKISNPNAKSVCGCGNSFDI